MFNSLPLGSNVNQEESIPVLPYGKFVLIKDGRIMGYFSTYYAACRYGFTNCEKGNFSVEESRQQN
ncbi:hypothetical protein [Rufibacter tibetensis]|uniref:Uncharacterized protein n=1 Tax=Rufibacter tibetensis TaxID=512763 RepID=A0A0P0CVM6_9BACT|nr:hypothetical protein [Rufibacter tibetensis]ALJ01662.1 hypothetical protein DC20_21625 [Rufibacter tibetensis]